MTAKPTVVATVNPRSVARFRIEGVERRAGEDPFALEHPDSDANKNLIAVGAIATQLVYPEPEPDEGAEQTSQAAPVKAARAGKPAHKKDTDDGTSTDGTDLNAPPES